jgi:transcriptional regulator with XRE-family HTH domain
MYTTGVLKKQSDKEITELGRFLRQWRADKNLTVEEAAERAGFSTKSIWTKIENGQKKVALETLYALSQLTGRTLDDLANKLGLPIRYSRTSEDRGHRVAALVDVEPNAAALVDLLPLLTPAQIDVMLSVGEGLRKDQK